MEFINKKRCVVVGGGVITDSTIIKENVFYDDFVIAADKGYEFCNASGVTPDLIVGDFDSADFPKTDVEIIALNPVKDCTDMEFAVNEAVNHGFSDILIIGGLGGRIDHSFANFAVCAAFCQRNISITIIDENHRIYALKDEERIVINEDKYISIFAYGGDCQVTLNGFFYPLDKYHLSAFSALGVSNELIEKTGKIQIENGTAIIMEVSKTL